MDDLAAFLPRSHPRLRLPGPEPGLTLVMAPAGYGKSVLLRQWQQDARRQQLRVVGLDLESRHREPTRLFTDLSAALVTACLLPPLPSASAGSDCSTTCSAKDFGLLARSLLGARQIEPSNALLFLDGAEKLAEAGSALGAFVEEAAQWLRVVLASRIRPALHFSRLYVQGGVQEIGVPELRFTSEETEAYLRQTRRTPESSTVSAQLFHITEGWPAGLRLIRNALEEAAVDVDYAAETTEKLATAQPRVNTYFAEHVLSGEPSPLREFLIKVSILDRPTPQLCDALLGTADGTASALLDACEQRGLFLHHRRDNPIEFQFHELFSRYLRSELHKLPTREQQSLHQRASNWLFKQGLFREAFEHALAAAQPELAAIALEASAARHGSVLGRELLKLTARLPESVRDLRPRLLLSTAWVAIFYWEFDQAEELLRACRQYLDRLSQAPQQANPPLAELEHLYAHQQMMLALFQDDMPRVQTLCDRLMHDYVSATPWVKASLLISLIQAHTDQYRLRDAESLAARARKLLERSGHPLPQIPLAMALAQARLMSGLHRAGIEELTRETENACRVHSPEASDSATMVAVPLAEMHYELNETQRAQELLEHHLPEVPTFGFLDIWISGRVVRSRLLHLSGDYAGSLAALEIKHTWAPEGGLERMRRFFAADRVRLLLQTGRVQDAVRAAKDSGALGPLEAMLPDRTGVSISREARATAFVRLAQAQGRFRDALRVCNRWKGFLESAGAARALVRWSVLTAGVLLASGQQRAAQRALRQAILAAAPSSYLRSILDEGPHIGALLLDNPQLANDIPEPSKTFGAALISAFERELHREALPAKPLAAKVPTQHYREETRVDDQMLPGLTLSTREIEMLRMVAAGLMNREVAERLAMTEGSVKWYLYNLYKKLGVTRRTRAVHRARELGVVR